MAAGRRPGRLKRAAALLLLGLALQAAAGCSFRAVGDNPIRRLTKVGVEKERETGYEADLELRENLALIDDPGVLLFVHELGQSIVDTLGPQPFTYHFRVIEDPSLNAFALPGGYIYFHSGTLLRAGSLDEVAGVMAHEVAHVKGRHWARMVEQATIPNLLSSIAGILATVATGEPGALIVSQGVNVALQIRFTREFEAEADQLGSTFMARAGYDPKGMAVFFERIIAAEHAAGPSMEIPPYLYTHPDVDLRVDAAYQRAEKLTVTGHRPPLDRAFRAMQLQLAMTLDSGRSELRSARPPPDRGVTGPLLSEAKRYADAGDVDAALEALRAAAEQGPGDPRVPFQTGEVLEGAGRRKEAIEAYQRALRLDPGVALAYYRVGLLYRDLGDDADAAFYLEQAERRFEEGGALQERAHRVLERLTFPILQEAGLGDGADAETGGTPGGHAREAFGPGDDRVVWWGRVASRWMGARDALVVRFVDPEGEVVQEKDVKPQGRFTALSTLELTPALRERTGTWRVEVHLLDDVVDRRSFEVGSQAAVDGADAAQSSSR